MQHAEDLTHADAKHYNPDDPSPGNPPELVERATTSEMAFIRYEEGYPD
jgi:hypothetical protein